MSMWFKQPFESNEYVMDFTRRLQGLESISAIISVDVSPAGSVSVSEETVFGKRVQFRLSGGEEGSYLVSVRIASSAGNIHEWQQTLRVRDEI